MKETTHDETTATLSTRAAGSNDRPRRRLFVMRSGARLFAVYADEVEATSENPTPTPLPFTPAPVRGVVSQRGRILTLIDPLPLLHGVTTTDLHGATMTGVTTHGAQTADAAQTFAPPATRNSAPFVVALKGDEQLALSVEAVEHEIELYDDEVDAVADAPGSSLIRRTIQHHTHAVVLLDPARLFDAAMQGVERRRQRT